jgi:hypothetical protein
MIGCDLFINVMLKAIEAILINLISAGFILFKIVALGVTDGLLFISEVFMASQFLVYKTSVLV